MGGLLGWVRKGPGTRQKERKKENGMGRVGYSSTSATPLPSWEDKHN